MTHRVPIIALLLVLLAAPSAPRADHALVLIAHAESPMEDIRPIDLRKLYLGFSIDTANGDPIRVITNSSDPRLWEIFLQDVMGMTARSYDRRLLTLTLQTGRNRPEVIDNTKRLIDAVASDTNLLSFVWLEDVEDRKDCKILRVLWRH